MFSNSKYSIIFLIGDALLAWDTTCSTASNSMHLSLPWSSTTYLNGQRHVLDRRLLQRRHSSLLLLVLFEHNALLGLLLDRSDERRLR